MKKDFLSMADLSSLEVEELFKLTDRLKKSPYNHSLQDKVIVLFFEKPSTRTRISFEAGISHLGGKSIYVDATTTQMSRGETVEDTARTVGRFVDAIVARVYRHETLVRLAENSRVPVVNALSDLEHPCQALADLYTMRERVGDLSMVKVAFVGDGNNVCNSLMLGSAIAGNRFAAATPARYAPDMNVITQAKKSGGNRIELVTEPEEAVKDASFVYTDVFVSMGDEAERTQRLKAFLPKYQVNEVLMAKARNGAFFMHCLPAHRGEEVTAEVIDGPRSIVFDQAENRMHVQKALLTMLLGRQPSNLPNNHSGSKG
jgi:ornithine carbamoyltransferase